MMGCLTTRWAAGSGEQRLRVQWVAKLIFVVLFGGNRTAP